MRFFSLSMDHPHLPKFPTHAFRLSLNQEYQHLTHLALKGVSFVPSNHIPSLTHLALVVFMPIFHNQIVAFLSRCPNLELVLLHRPESPCTSNLSELAASPFQRLSRFTLNCMYLASDAVVDNYMHNISILPNTYRGVQILDMPRDDPSFARRAMKSIWATPRKISLLPPRVQFSVRWNEVP